MAIITTPAEMMPATWKTHSSHQQSSPFSPCLPARWLCASQSPFPGALGAPWPPPSAHTIERNKNYLLKLYKTEEKWKPYIYIAAMAEKWKKLWRLGLLNKASLTWISSGYIRPLGLGSVQEAKLLIICPLRKHALFSFPTIEYGNVLGMQILREFTDSSALLNQQP